MSLAMKSIHNLPPHLIRFCTKLKRNIDETSWSVDTWDRIFRASSTKPVTMANTDACTRKGKRTSRRTPLLWSRHTIGSFQSHLRYWVEENI